MNPAEFRALLARGPLLADGGTGTSLMAAGVPPEACFEDLNLSSPDLVVGVHRAFVEAGARLVVTNTFGANRYKLARSGVADRLRSICAAGARLARAAGTEIAGGSVGPLGVRLAPYGRVQRAEAREAFAAQINALMDGGVDLLVLETHTDLAELEQAVLAARETHLPVLATLTFTRDDRTLLGETAVEAARRLAALGVDALGVNCSQGPSQVLRLIEAMRPHSGGIPLVAKPNAGGPQSVGGRVAYPATPAYLAAHAAAFVAAGAQVVGGCCGTAPAHISAMAGALAEALAAPRASGPEPVPREPEPALESEPPEPPTRLARALGSGDFVISIEMDPPRGFSAARLVAAAETCAEAGADAISVADSPMARMRMSPWAACHLIQREAGIECVLHFPTRGRNLLRIQGDLLAAHALGIRNLFACMGDPTAIGDVPEAADRADVTASGLVALVKGSFNRGQDRAGASIGGATSFVVGCALDLNAVDLEREVRVLARKIGAGADFVLSQPVYDAGKLDRLRVAYEARHGPVGIPILVGILPLVTARHAEFLHNEVPGIEIPAAVRDRMAAAADPRAEGLAIASELVAGVRDRASGIYLIPPFGRYDLAAELVERVRRA